MAIKPPRRCQLTPASFFYDCKGCGQRLKPHPGDCCVFCSYGSVPCPPIQQNGKCCRGRPRVACRRRDAVRCCVVGRDDAMTAKCVRCLRYAQKRTSGLTFSTSVLCQKRKCQSALEPAFSNFAMTASRLKLAGFCRTGNSLKLCSHCVASACIGTWTKARSIIHLS